MLKGPSPGAPAYAGFAFFHLQQQQQQLALQSLDIPWPPRKHAGKHVRVHFSTS